MADNVKAVPVKWTPDCSGKQDFDGGLVEVSTRYWPRGGGFLVVRCGPEGTTVEDNDARPEIRPSATSTIYLGNCRDDFYDDAERLARQSFEGDTEEEVKAAVEAWVAAQFQRIGHALRAEFDATEPTERDPHA